MIKVYVMKYFEGGRQRWFSESMTRDMAFEVGRRFGLMGRKPVIHRIDIEPKRLMACGIVRTRTIDSRNKKRRA